MATWTPRLSKSRFQAGLQCPKYLWLQCRAPKLADPITEGQQAIFDQGHAVGALARDLFPGGVLVEEDYTQADQALETTQCLLGDGAGCLYEGAFRYDGVFVRPDALFKEDGHNWALVEVKSSTEVKPEYITDLGIQTYVLRGAGVPVGSSPPAPSQQRLRLSRRLLRSGAALHHWRTSPPRWSRSSSPSPVCSASSGRCSTGPCPTCR